MEQVVSQSGRLDYMFNNTGVVVAGEVVNLTLKDWRWVIEINLWGVIHGVNAAYTVMVRQGYGHIVNTASLSGLATTPILTAYSTTKHGVVGLSQALPAEAKRYGVRVTALCPGFIKTNIYDAASYANTNKEELLPLVTNSVGLVEVDRAAQLILEGAASNKALVVFPFYARLLWWLERLNPALGELWGRLLLTVARRTHEKVRNRLNPS